MDYNGHPNKILKYSIRSLILKISNKSVRVHTILLLVCKKKNFIQPKYILLLVFPFFFNCNTKIKKSSKQGFYNILLSTS